MVNLIQRLKLEKQHQSLTPTWVRTEGAVAVVNMLMHWTIPRRNQQVVNNLNLLKDPRPSCQRIRIMNKNAMNRVANITNGTISAALRC